MVIKPFPVIDPVATGKNIVRLRKLRGLSVRDLQNWFGFEEPQAIYKWQKGKSLPTIDNLYALGALLDVPMEDILVSSTPNLNIAITGQQAEACCPDLLSGCFGYGRGKRPRQPFFVLRHGKLPNGQSPVTRLSIQHHDMRQRALFFTCVGAIGPGNYGNVWLSDRIIDFANWRMNVIARVAV